MDNPEHQILAILRFILRGASVLSFGTALYLLYFEQSPQIFLAALVFALMSVTLWKLDPS